jgi:L-ascorbate metabolism protein UlaG (beta-lactamase superfamily)
MVAMEITYFGHSCFKIKTKELTIIVDPFDPEKLGVKLAKLEGDAVLITHGHFDHSYKEGVSGYRLLVDGPGEYELSGVKIMGILTSHATDPDKNSSDNANTMYYIEAEDGVSVLHCGDLGHTLDDTTLQKFGEVTALLIPVGGVYTIDAEKASKVISSIAPAFVVPMHYKMAGSKIGDIETLEKFLDEMGLENGAVKRSTTLKISSADNEAETQVIVLEKQ